MKISDFDTLTFDCYGTLIDWDSGIFAALGPLLSRARIGAAGDAVGLSRAGMGLSRSGVELSRDEVLEAFGRLEARQQEKTPDMIYSDLLAEVHGQLAIEWDVARDQAEDADFGRSIGVWPAFPDTVEALRYLRQHFRLVILFNVDRDSFRATGQRLGVAFDAVYTAQDIGSYKPSLRNFEYMLEKLGGLNVTKEAVLHTAESMFHDHKPANEVGLKSCWIYRRHADQGFGATMHPGDMPHYDFRFTSMAELAKAHQQELHG